MENIFLTIKDEDGVLRPAIGIWRYNEADNKYAEGFKLMKGEKIVKVKIEEIK